MIQHLVSRVVLRRFANHSRGLISGLDLDSLKQRTDTVKKFGGFKDIDLDAPNDTEKIWSKEVEKPLPYAFKLLDGGSILADPKAVTTIKNCIALHYARGFAAREIVDKIFVPDTVQKTKKAILEQFTRRQALFALTGSQISFDPQALDKVIQAEFTEKLRLERFMDDAFLDLYRRGQEFLETKSLEIWHSQYNEFLLGDIPVVTHGKGSGKVGILDNVSWGKSNILFMPLGLHYVVAVSREPAYKEAGARMVERLNVYQVRAALKEIYFRPGSGLGDIVADALRENN